MLRKLALHNVGPAADLVLDPIAPRLNLLTGDNGLGKSFLLDVAWWALTRHWPREVNPRLVSGYPAKPRSRKAKATLSFTLKSKSKDVSYESTYSAPDEAWTGKVGRPWNPGLVIYAHAEGGFSVWDPARNYWKTKGDIDVQDRPPAYVFTAAEVWDGLWVEEGGGRRTPQCKGLLEDWANWIRANGVEAKTMADVLLNLTGAGANGAASEEGLIPGDLVRISKNDVRDIPTIRTSYGGDVPILHASSGVRRTAALAYMLTWAVAEHSRAVELSGEEPAKQMIMLFDEVESHLHPRWQRTVLPSLFRIAGALGNQVPIQFLVATHSPLVMASIEPIFDPAQDTLWKFDLVDGKVQIEADAWRKRGDAAMWLVSDVFDLPTASSREAEAAMADAAKVMASASSSRQDADAIRTRLRGVLADTDSFWLSFRAWMRSRGWNP